MLPNNARFTFVGNYVAVLTPSSSFTCRTNGSRVDEVHLMHCTPTIENFQNFREDITKVFLSKKGCKDVHFHC